ncbi:hypothetical protein Ndes2437A_g01224 [Nannochloris sp. 'desiccata']|nr:hypothetical protein KSW81_006315 [Chlorella desiccata (nom. nud.)]
MLRLFSLHRHVLQPNKYGMVANRQFTKSARFSKQLQLVSRATGSSGNGGDSSEAFPAAMTLADAYQILGLKESATYDSVVEAKNRLLGKFEGQMEKKEEIETAYDLIFSQQLKARLSGNLPVSNRVRFADVSAPKRKPLGKKGPLELPGGAAITVRQMSSDSAVSTAAVFGGLAAWTLAQGLFFEPTPMGSDVPGLQLALGTAAAVYLLRENKRVGLGKAGALAIAGLIAGSLLGSGIESWLRVDIVPLGSLSSPGIVVGEFALAGLWAVTFFLA